MSYSRHQSWIPQCHTIYLSCAIIDSFIGLQCRGRASRARSLQTPQPPISVRLSNAVSKLVGRGEATQGIGSHNSSLFLEACACACVVLDYVSPVQVNSSWILTQHSFAAAIFFIYYCTCQRWSARAIGFFWPRPYFAFAAGRK